MLKYLIMCRSLTYAQRSAKELEKAGITAIVAKAPGGTSKAGCAYCVKVSERRLSEAVQLLTKAGLEPKRIFLLLSDGSTEEVTGW